MKALRAFYLELDRILRNAANKSAADGMPFTCRKGCFHCCAEPLFVTKTEARAAIEAIPASELAGVKERTVAWMEKSNASGLLAREPRPDATAYRSERLMCPLLKDGLCLVYESRPTGCRCHNAIGDPENCADLSKRPHQKFAVVEHLHQWCSERLLVMGNGNEFDHLGAFLARLVLNRDFKSAARLKVELTSGKA